MPLSKRGRSAKRIESAVRDLCYNGVRGVRRSGLHTLIKSAHGAVLYLTEPKRVLVAGGGKLRSPATAERITVDYRSGECRLRWLKPRYATFELWFVPDEAPAVNAWLRALTTSQPPPPLPMIPVYQFVNLFVYRTPKTRSEMGA